MSPIIISLNEEEVRLCEDSAKGSWVATEKRVKDRFDKGCIGTDPWYPVLIGNMGEVAFSKYINIPHELTYKKFGDKGDFSFYWKNKNYRINIKTTKRCPTTPNSTAGYVKIIESNGRSTKLDDDYFVFAAILSPNEVSLNGYIHIEDLLEVNRMQSPYGSWVNAVPTLSELKPIHRIQEFFEQKAVAIA
jgi:hypothetical protein